MKLWDLRKLKNFKTLTMNDRYEVKSLTFDQSGTYLAVTGTDVHVYLCKQWQELKTFTKHTSLATGVSFGKNARFLASTGMDRSLKFYGICKVCLKVASSKEIKLSLLFSLTEINNLKYLLTCKLARFPQVTANYFHLKSNRAWLQYGFGGNMHSRVFKLVKIKL